MRVLRVCTLLTLALSCLFVESQAEAPHQMNLQGVLVDSLGSSIRNDTVSVTFTIYDAASGGSAKWTEVNTVGTDNAGVFSIVLGASSPIPDSVFSDTLRWLGIQVAAEPELTPRTQLVSTPFSFVSGNGAMGAGGGWTDDGSVVRLTDGADSVGIGTSTPTEHLEVAGNALITGKATIGSNHTNTGVAAFVAGDSSTASGFYSTVGGGLGNVSGNDQTVVAGGAFNTASGVSTVVSGGYQNAASGQDATVAGGFADTASGFRSTVSGGNLNSATNEGATVSGGATNTASGQNSTVSGGFGNVASGQDAVVGGGAIDTAIGTAATVGGGVFNTAAGNRATIAGGIRNRADGSYSSIGGGRFNFARGISSTVSGGGGSLLSDSNSAIGDFSTVGGGQRNVAAGINSVIGGGLTNLASQTSATVGGGQNNVASDQLATVAGGLSNVASGNGAAIGGGGTNTATGIGATVAGGDNNMADADLATVGGGQFDTANGIWATVPGGYLNKATGSYSLAAGKRAKALHSGAFVWADAFSNLDFTSTNSNQFLIRSQFTGIGRNYQITSAETFGIKRATAGFGGMYMETDADGEPFYGYATDSIARAYHYYSSADGTWRVNLNSTDQLVLRSDGYLGIDVGLPSFRLQLPNLAGSAGQGLAWGWPTYSSRRWKTDIQTMPDALSKVDQLRGVTYKDKESGTPSIGLIAEEVGEVFPEIVAYEDNGVDARSVDYARLVSVLIEAVKELKVRSEHQEARIEELRSEVAALSGEPTGTMGAISPPNPATSLASGQSLEEAR